MSPFPPPYRYERGSGTAPGRFTAGGKVFNLNIPSDRYEVFSHIFEARSWALGAQPNVKGPFSENGVPHQVRLDAGPYAFTNHQWDHSAQFNGTNMARRYYWNQLMQVFGIDPWDPNLT